MPDSATTETVRPDMLVGTAANILTNLSKREHLSMAECRLVVQVDGTDRFIELIESEDYNHKGNERFARIILKTSAGQ